MEINVRDILPKRLKWLREKNRYSQTEIAKMIGMSLNGYQKTEYGQRDPKLDILLKFAEIYDETTDFLLGRNDTPNDLFMLKTELILQKQEIESQEELFRSSATVDLPEDVFHSLRERNGVVRIRFKNKLLKYLKEFVNIPLSNPENDELLKSLIPIDFGIKDNEDGSMSITMKCANGYEYEELERIHVPNNINEQVELLEDRLEFYGERLK